MLGVPVVESGCTVVGSDSEGDFRRPAGIETQLAAPIETKQEEIPTPRSAEDRLWLPSTYEALDHGPNWHVTRNTAQLLRASSGREESGCSAFLYLLFIQFLSNLHYCRSLK